MNSLKGAKWLLSTISLWMESPREREREDKILKTQRMAQDGHCALSPRHREMPLPHPRHVSSYPWKHTDNRTEMACHFEPVVIFSLQGTWMNGLWVSFWSAFSTHTGDSLWGPISGGPRRLVHPHRPSPFHLLPLRALWKPNKRQTCKSFLTSRCHGNRGTSLHFRQ